MRSAFDRVFRSRVTGRVTIAQMPNLALWIFFATVVLRRIVATGSAPRTVVDWVGVAALGWWALDEVIRGVNPWRRVLGLGGCAATVAGIASLLR
jgi:hypothetical protein